MQSSLKEFRLPLDNQMQETPLSQSQKYERQYSDHFSSQQQQQYRRNSIQDHLKQQIFKPATHSVNNSPERNKICFTPKKIYQKYSQNLIYNQDGYSPKPEKQMILIVNDLNNKDYKIISKEQLNHNNSNKQYSIGHQGTLLSNLKLNQVSIKNIQLPVNHEHDMQRLQEGYYVQNEYGVQIENKVQNKYREQNKFSYQDEQREQSGNESKRDIQNQDVKPMKLGERSRAMSMNNSQQKIQKDSLNSTYNRLNSDIKLTNSSNQIFKFDKIKSQNISQNSHNLNKNVSSNYFPSSMPVKTRKYRLKKENIFDKAIFELKRKESIEAKQKIRSNTLYSQKFLNTGLNEDYSIDNLYNTTTTNKSNSFNNKQYMKFETNPSYSTDTLQDSRILSNQSTQFTKKIRNGKVIISKSILQAKQKQNDLYSIKINSQDNIDFSKVQTNLSYDQFIEVHNKKVFTQENDKYIDYIQPKQPQNIQKSIEKQGVQIDLYQANIEQNSNNICKETKSTQNDDEGFHPQNPIENENENEQEMIQLKEKYKPIAKQELIKYNFQNQFLQNSLPKRLFNNYKIKQQFKQEMPKSNSSNKYQFNYFTFKKITQ